MNLSLEKLLTIKEKSNITAETVFRIAKVFGETLNNGSI